MGQSSFQQRQKENGGCAVANYSRVLEAIAASKDPKQLRRFQENAREKGVPEIVEAAFLRLLEILPDEVPGSVEHDFWKTIHAFEEILREERGKTVRLSRTRQKIGRVGIMQTLQDFATSKAPTEGFNMLIERKMPELTGEALILKHRDSFDADVTAAARARLIEAGVEIESLRYS
ncbi:MAG: hypothetical protein ACI9IV_001174 [Paracoccaceae bacterium]